MAKKSKRAQGVRRRKAKGIFDAITRGARSLSKGFRTVRRDVARHGGPVKAAVKGIKSLPKSLKNFKDVISNDFKPKQQDTELKEFNKQGKPRNYSAETAYHWDKDPPGATGSGLKKSKVMYQNRKARRN